MLLACVCAMGFMSTAHGAHLFYTLSGDANVLTELPLLAGESATLDIHLGADFGEVASVDIYMIEAGTATFSAQSVNPAAGFAFSAFPGDGVTQDYLAGFSLTGLIPGVLGTFTVTTLTDYGVQLGASPLSVLADLSGNPLDFAVTPVIPEPASLALLAFGALAVRRRRG